MSNIQDDMAFHYTAATPAPRLPIIDEIQENNRQEKETLQKLNNRLESYIERVRSLEQTNRELIGRLQSVRGSVGPNIFKYKEESFSKLKIVRKDVETSHRTSIEKQVKADRLERDLEILRERCTNLDRQNRSDHSKWEDELRKAEQELHANKARYEQALEEERRLNEEQELLYAELARANDDLDTAIAEKLYIERSYELDTVELEFISKINETDLREVQSLLAFSPEEVKGFFETELQSAISEIQREYDHIMTTTKTTLEMKFIEDMRRFQSSIGENDEINRKREEEISRMRSSIDDYRQRLIQLENENKRLEDQVAREQSEYEAEARDYNLEIQRRDESLKAMREDCELLIAELEQLLSTKQMLNSEIELYRRLVNYEETRMPQQVQKVNTDVIISRCDKEGRFVTLENISQFAENIGSFQIERVIDGVKAFSYTIVPPCVIQPGKTLTIYAANAGGVHSPPNTYVMNDRPSWGTGRKVETALINREGKKLDVLSHIHYQ